MLGLVVFILVVMCCSLLWDSGLLSWNIWVFVFIWCSMCVWMLCSVSVELRMDRCEVIVLMLML